MDGGSGLNILYIDTLGSKINRERIRPTRAPFHIMIPGKQAIPLGQIHLPMTFGDRSNFQKETLTFKVVDFSDSYNTILGRLCYAKFMAVANYIITSS